jgi:hypothetical protein
MNDKPICPSLSPGNAKGIDCMEVLRLLPTPQNKCEWKKSASCPQDTKTQVIPGQEAASGIEMTNRTPHPSGEGMMQKDQETGLCGIKDSKVVYRKCR